MPSEPNPEFTAGRDVVDSLKLEASNISPRLDRELRMVAKKAGRLLEGRYQKFIPKTTIKRARGFENRILVTDSETFGMIWKEWDTISPETEPDADTKGIYFVQGRVMAFDDLDKLWGIYPKLFRDKIASDFGSEEKAKAVATWIGLTDNLVHEAVHQYQDLSLPRYFLELGTRYYQRQITDEIKIGHILEDLAENRIAFYNELVGQFGDDVHKLFFGKSSQIDELQKLEILVKCWLKESELFPNGY